MLPIIYSEDVVEGTSLEWVECVSSLEDGSMKTAFHIFLQVPMEKNYCAHFVVYDHYYTIYVLLTWDAALCC